MADKREREIERRALQGDPEASLALVHARIRNGELPALSHRLPPLERVESWLADRAVGGVSVSPLDLGASDVGSLALSAAQGTRLRWWVPYAQPDQVRTLIRRLVEDLHWIDCCRLSIQPVQRLQHFECVADVLLFRPERLFQSQAALEAIDSVPDVLSAAVATAMDQGVAALGEEDAEGFLEALRDYATTRAFTIGFDDNPIPFVDRAPKALLPLAEDARLLADLDRSHLGLVERLDEWVNTHRVSASGALVGRVFSLPVWTTFQSVYGVDSLPEIREDDGDVPRVDAEALYDQVADIDLPDVTRRDAARLLAELSPAQGMPWQLRLLGWPDYRDIVLRQMCSLERLLPLLEALVLERSSGRIEEALARLRGYGEGFEDPLEAWRRARSAGPSQLGHLNQETLLSIACELQPRLIPTVVAALEDQANGLEPLRRNAWTEAALSGLQGARAAAATDVAFQFTRADAVEIRVAALRFFRAANFPPVWPALRAAVHSNVQDLVAAGEAGFVGQTGLSEDELYEILQHLDLRARGEVEELEYPHIARAQRGVGILQALGERGSRPLGSRGELVIAVGERALHLPATARRFVTRVVHSQAAKGSAEGPATIPTGSDLGAGPAETFEVRYGQWTEPGFVQARYLERGHRGEWDGSVAAAHVSYEARAGDSGALDYQRAVDAGCVDGMVFYRLGATVMNDSVRAVALFEQSAERLAEQYPDSPYRGAAFEAVGRLRVIQGRRDEALAAYRQGALEPIVPPTLSQALKRLEAEQALRNLAPESISSLRAGSLKRLPSRWHSERVSGLALQAVSRDQVLLLSCDTSGWVQVSELQGERELLPIAGFQGHPAGDTACDWDGKLTVLSAGSDGRIARGVLTDRDLAVETVLTHDEPVTALTRLDDGGLAFGDARGHVFVTGPDGVDRRALPPTADLGAVQQLVALGRHLVARTGVGIVAWDLSEKGSGRPSWQREVPAVVLARSPSLQLAVALPLGGAEELEVRTGERLRALPCPRPERLLSLHFGPAGTDASVWVWPRGPILIDGPGRTTGIVSDPLALTAASFEARCVAYADIGHRLRLLPWNA